MLTTAKCQKCGWAGRVDQLEDESAPSSQRPWWDLAGWLGLFRYGGTHCPKCRSGEVIEEP